MKKRILSLALVLVLVLALTVPALAATGKTERLDGTRVTVSNVISVSEKESDIPKNWHSREAEFDDLHSQVMYYCDAAPVTVTFEESYEYPLLILRSYWRGRDVYTPPTENLTEYIVDKDYEEYFGGSTVHGAVTLHEPGIYLFEYAVAYEAGAGDNDFGFYVVVGGSTPTPSIPAPTTPAPATPAPLTPAPVAPASGSTAALKTTDGLVSVIPPAPVKDKDLAYTVQKGETLWGIAYNYYGSMSGATVSKIKSANTDYFKKTKGILEAGAVITLPAKGLINPVTQSGLDKAAGVYLVKAGDTLADIAKAYYGDTKQWKKIYEANKDRVKLVGNSPMIYEKQWLVIPE